MIQQKSSEFESNQNFLEADEKQQQFQNQDKEFLQEEELSGEEILENLKKLGVHLELPQTDQSRWLVLMSFCSLTFLNAAGFVILAPIQDQAKIYYNKSSAQVEWLINIWYLAFIPFVLPILPTFKFMRFHHCFYLSSFINMSGALMRIWAKNNYSFTLATNFIQSFTQNWSLQAPGIIAERFFDSSERVTATSIAFFANCLGLSFGYLFSAYLVGQQPDRIDLMNQVFGYINIIPFLLILAFFKEKPKHIANFSQLRPQIQIIQDIQIVFCNIKNLINLISLTCFLGVSWTFSGVIQIILSANLSENNKFSSIEVGYVGLTMNLAGTFGGLAASILMENSLAKRQVPKYTLIIKTFGTISMFCVVIFTFLIHFYKECPHWIIFINTALIGLGFNAFVPFASQGFMESVYPISEIVGFTLYFLMANLWGLLGNLMSLVGLWLLCAILFPFYIYLIFFYKTELKRYKAENKISKSFQQSFHYNKE